MVAYGRLYVATHSEQLSFNMLHRVCGTRIRQQLWCPRCERVIERNETAKGYEFQKDRYVIDGRPLREIAPRNLAFYAGDYDMSSPFGVTPPMLADFKAQAPKAICEVTSVNVPRTLLINLQKPPFDNPDLRRAMSLAIDRDAFSTIINGGVRHVGSLMLPPPNGV